MKEVNIYVASSIRGRWERDGYIGYVLEYYPEGRRYPETLHGHEHVSGMNENRSQTEALIRAFARMREKCAVTIYTESEYLYNGFAGMELVKQWESNGWKTVRGTEVKNRDRWEELRRLTNGMLYRFLLRQDNAYLPVLREELRMLAAGEITLEALQGTRYRKKHDEGR